MDPQEVKDRLKTVITHLVKDDAEAAKAELHDVLAAKMRDRVSPPEELTPEPEEIDDQADLEPEAT